MNPPGSDDDACYEEVASADPIKGWIYRSNDSSNSCPGGGTYLFVNPPGGNNSYDACFEEVTEPEYTVSSDWEYVGPPVEVCEEETVVPGSWQSLTGSDNAPSHAECRDDVTNSVDDNGPGQGVGYPQNNVINGNEYGPSADSTVEWGDTPYTFYTSNYLEIINAELKLSVDIDLVTDLSQGISHKNNITSF